MKRFVTSFFAVLLFTCLIAFQTSVNANVMSAQLSITNPDGSDFDGDFGDGSNAAINFFLNDSAGSVTVEIIESLTGNAVHTIDAGAMDRGMHSVDWDGTGAIASVSYQIRITASQNNVSTTEWRVMWDSGDIDIFTRGAAVVTDQTDTNFGKIFTSNDGGPLGTGINIYNADGSFHDPFLVAEDPTVTYGTDAPIFAVLDEQGRVYVSLKDLGQVMRINRDYSATLLIDGLNNPKGLYVEGDGDDFTMYVCANDQVLRGTIGTANSFSVSNMETVAQFTGFFPHQVMLDDDGAMYTTLRADNGLGSDGRGIRKFDISGTLPVGDNDALWFLMEDRTFIANDLLLDSGADPDNSSDDILYYTTRAGGGNDQDGVWRIDDINSFFPDTVRIITEDALYGGDENINARSAIDFDAAGNIVLMENSNEHVFFLSPPGIGATNSFTTTSAQAFSIGVVGIEDEGPLTINGYQLYQNYPNPFNPQTSITYYLGESSQTEVTVYNMRGQKVKTLVSDFQMAGEHTLVWNGVDESGRQVVSGVYILNLQSGQFRKAIRMVLSR